VILFHSQAGQFGFKVAQARPDKVKALVAVEPAGVGDAKQAAVLKDIPTLVVFGDNIALDSRWPQIRKNAVDFVGGISKAGGKVDIVDLPSLGIRGNSHMLMMDKNNLQVAALIQDWLAKQGLVR
jgi:pimeloyl-ACP methyl ester carboxylesterase